MSNKIKWVVIGVAALAATAWYLNKNKKAVTLGGTGLSKVMNDLSPDNTPAAILHKPQSMG